MLSAFFVLLFLNSPLANELAFIDVGQGNATLIKFQNSPPMIVDSGSSELRGQHKQEKRDFKLATIASIRSHIERFLLNVYRIGNIDLNVVISHPHGDHYNLVCPVFENAWMKDRKVRFLLGGRKEDYELTSEGKKLVDLVNTYCPSNRFVRDFPENSISPLEGGQILVAPIVDDADLNAHSIVLHIKAGAIEAILTGDAISKVTDAILKAYEHNLSALKTKIFQACHHGSTTHGSNDEAFIKAVEPQCVVFSSGTKYKHPSSVVVRRVLTHVTAQKDMYHILRYHHDDLGEPGDISSEDGKKVITKKKYSPLIGYVLSATNLQIFNTQDQGTIKFAENVGAYSVNHSGKRCALSSGFLDGDFIE